MMKETLNSAKYAFQDFNHASYCSLIRLALEKKYRFLSYKECLHTEGPWVVWRHDVDFSPERALELATIEHEMGVKSTYFLLMHSPFYNLFEKQNFEMFCKIRELGHDLALHFDFAFYESEDKKYIEECIISEKNFLERTFNQKVDSFSFHNPNEWALNYGQNNVAGMVNAYSTFFFDNVNYASDSNGVWRNDSIEDRILEGHEKLQLLTHPVWWTEEITSPQERMWSAVNGRFERDKTDLLEFWKKWGRSLIDW